jgi:long-chain acyl-CoA synthetase
MSFPMTRAAALEQLTAKGEYFELAEAHVAGRTIRTFVNAPANLREIYAAGRSPLPFIVYGEERLSFEDVWRRSCRLASVLVGDFGVAKGDRVAISMRNYPEWIITFNAITSIGAIAVAFNSLWQPAELEFALNDSLPKVLFVDGERLARVADCAVPASLAIIAARTTGEIPGGFFAYAALMASGVAEDMPAVDILPDDDAIMLYTSGSTGHPKGVVSTHRNIISALLSGELDGRASILCGLIPEPLADGPQGAGLLGVPLFHVSGLHTCALSSYRAQRRLVLMYKWDPELAATLVESEGVTMFAAPAAMTGDLVRATERSGGNSHSLALIGGGGAARAPDQVKALERVFPGALPATGWGMTETNSAGTSIVGADYVQRPESSGRVSAVLDIRIVDEEGRALPAMSRGELQIRGATIMRGYWNRPQADADIFVDGWMRTGDIAYLDHEGFIYIVDRIKDLVIRGGENIGCGMVEAALLEHPDILEACVYGVPDERLGEEVAVTLYSRAAISEPALTAFLATRLAKFQIPRYFRFSGEPLPRGASGKILKRELRDQAITQLLPSTVLAG